MKAGQFNINEYLERLYEGFDEDDDDKEEKDDNSSDEKASKPKSSGKPSNPSGAPKAEKVSDGNLPNKEGLIIPDENKKTYDWLKREYQKGQTEVKVEISMGGAKFEPGYDLQTDLKSVKEFKPGMFGQVKTTENPNPKKPESLDTKKESGSFRKGESEGQKKELPRKEGGEKKELPKTNVPKGDINNRETGKEEGKEKEGKPEVKKIDLKTKKK